MYKWVHALINDCLTCQSNKHKRHELHQGSLQEWSEKVPLPFHTVHIDHKGPINPKSFGNQHCLVVVDAFSRFIQVYPVPTTSAADTIKAMEKFITTFGIPQKLVYDRGTAFMNADFTNWAKELGITMAPRTAYSPWTNGKVETQNRHLARYFRNFLNENANNWAKLAHQFAFAHNTTTSYTTGTSPYEIVFGTKPQIPLSLKLGLHRNRARICASKFCEGLKPHTHTEQFTNNEAVDRFLSSEISKSVMDRENTFKKVYSETYEKSRTVLEKARQYRNRYKLAKRLKVGQKVLLEDHSTVIGVSKKLCELRTGPYTVTKVITEVTYEITLDNDPTVKKAVHRNHLIEYYPASDTLPPMIEEYFPTGHSRDEEFYQNLAKLPQNIIQDEKHIEPLIVVPPQQHEQAPQIPRENQIGIPELATPQIGDTLNTPQCVTPQCASSQRTQPQTLARRTSTLVTQRNIQTPANSRYRQLLDAASGRSVFLRQTPQQTENQNPIPLVTIPTPEHTQTRSSRTGYQLRERARTSYTDFKGAQNTKK